MGRPLIVSRMEDRFRWLPGGRVFFVLPGIAALAGRVSQSFRPHSSPPLNLGPSHQGLVDYIGSVLANELTN
jgi:hypothetical protein